MELYNKLLFIILIIGFAYFLKRLKVFSEKDAQVFVNYVIYFALPLTIIKNFTGINLDKNLIHIPLFAWFSIIIGLITSYFLGKLLSLPENSLKSFMLISSFGNTAFLGYPFSYALFGEKGLTYAIIFDQLGSFTLVITLGLFIAIGRFDVKELVSFPPFIALCLSLLLHNTNFPEFLDYFLQVSSASLIPVILFSLGLKFEPLKGFSSPKALMAALFIKMVLLPLSTLMLLKLFSLKGEVYKVILLESGMPPMVFAGVLALKYNLDFRLAFSAITLGIPLSFITIPLFLRLL
ncbi:AEC family transporter [Aquifex sp.]